MKLILEINGVNKTFHSIEFRGVQYLKLIKEVKKIYKIKLLNEKNCQKLFKFICKCFGNKFTKGQLKDSISKDDIIPLCIKLMGEYEKQVLDVANKSKLAIALSELK